MKASILLVLKCLYLILFFGITACETYSMKVVTDFNASVKLEAENNSIQTGIVRIKLKIKSNTNQPLSMELRSNDNLVREIYLKAGNTITILADCYSNYAEIAFIGNTPNNGSIEVKYKFVEI